MMKICDVCRQGRRLRIHKMTPFPVRRLRRCTHKLIPSPARRRCRPNAGINATSMTAGRL
ncbi:unnamed protein product [Linum tenue]|uniref:Uncharacterized protein n=1 Tax=Linum tenue TaxID=586396 RepID=A0AAV0HAA1_9ROSI|nr:unnamed protein product [Linum tenue]